MGAHALREPDPLVDVSGRFARLARGAAGADQNATRHRDHRALSNAVLAS
jgi:hypothetical protein